MASFICAVSTDGSAPAAFALVEQTPAADGGRPAYTVRLLDRFGDDPVEELSDALAGQQQYAGHVTVVTTGGQPVADLFHDGGLSAVAVETRRGSNRDADTTPVSEQVLVDTFEAAYRHSAVEMPGSLDLGSAALAALYGAMGDDAGASEASDRMAALAEAEATGEEVSPVPADGPKPAVVEQSGSEANVSTAVLGGDESDRTAPNVPLTAPEGNSLAQNPADRFESVDLGEDRDVALALALAVWYGEHSADALPTTDQADETARARQIRNARQKAARARDGQR